MNDRLLLCACWLVYLGVVIVTGGLAALLADWQHALVIAAAAIFALLVVLAWWGRPRTAATPSASGVDQVLTTLVHCLPLFLVAGLGVSSLGGQAFSVGGFRAPPATGDKDPHGELTIADVYAENHPLPDHATLTGLAYAPSDEEYQRLPGGLVREQAPLLLYRFQITCCAADAVPVYVIVRGLDRSAHPNDTWLTISGRLEAPAPPANLGVLHAETVTVVPEPAQPYLRRSP